MKALAVPLALIVVIVGFIVVSAATFTVDETQQVVLTQFGAPVGEPITEAGLHFKLPFVQAVNYFDGRLLEWDGDPNKLSTRDKRFLFVDTFARWRITNARKFLENVRGDEQFAQARLDDILDGKARDAVRSHDLIEVVRDSNRVLQEVDDPSRAVTSITIGRSDIAEQILLEARPVVEELGIELVDFRFKRINYEEDVRKSVYERMKSERRRIAEEYRSEGEGEAERILGDMERELLEIESNAYRQVQEIRGRADAQATTIYATAYSPDPDFYAFWQSMQLLKETFDGDTTVVLTTGGEVLRYLNNPENE